MNQAQILSFVRQALTLLGSIALAKGWVDETTLTQVIGAASILIAFGWSMVTHGDTTTTDTVGTTTPPASNTSSNTTPSSK